MEARLTLGKPGFLFNFDQTGYSPCLPEGFQAWPVQGRRAGIFKRREVSTERDFYFLVCGLGSGCPAHPVVEANPFPNRS